MIRPLTVEKSLEKMEKYSLKNKQLKKYTIRSEPILHGLEYIAFMKGRDSY